MAQALERGLALPFYVDRELHLQRSPINVAFVESGKPFDKFLLGLFETEFIKGSDRFLKVGTKGDFPQAATVGVQIIDDGLEKQRLPGNLQGRHTKPREDKKAAFVFTTPSLPDNISMENDTMSRWMRRLITRNPCHFGIVIEGEATATGLKKGARAVVHSMEGNTQVITYRGEKEGDEAVFIHAIAQRLRDQAGAHSVTHKEGIKLEEPTFEVWRTRPEVEGFTYASHLLATTGRLTDINLGEDVGVIQKNAILRMIRQAGLTAGNLASVVRDFGEWNAVLAMTETGIKKTKIDPAKGEIIPIISLMPDGAKYLILKGLPKGHPRTILRHPSWTTFAEVCESALSAFRRGRMRDWVKDIAKEAVFIDHPFSVEGLENAEALRFISLLERGIVNSLPEYLEYHTKELETYKETGTIPFIPEGVEVAADAAIHTHDSYDDHQEDPLIEVVSIEEADEDMQQLGFAHTPSCGTAESLVSLLVQIDRSYRIYGVPRNRKKIREVHMRGHGTYGWGYAGIRNLADRFVETKLRPHVVRY